MHQNTVTRNATSCNIQRQKYNYRMHCGRLRVCSRSHHPIVPMSTGRAAAKAMAAAEAVFGHEGPFGFDPNAIREDANRDPASPPPECRAVSLSPANTDALFAQREEPNDCPSPAIPELTAETAQRAQLSGKEAQARTAPRARPKTFRASHIAHLAGHLKSLGRLHARNHRRSCESRAPSPPR
jgi:hypothetical protein